MRIYLAIFILLIGRITFGQNNEAKPTTDTFHSTLLNEVVVTASRLPENILRSPVSIQKAGRVFFTNSSAPSFFDALENIKGVQMITPSLGFRIVNTRGFANTTNVRFTQLVDGMDIQSPHIGSPIGNVLGPGDLDIESVEIIPGMSSALYGMNTVNGLAQFNSRDPFQSEGLSVQQKTAVTHLGDANSSAKLFSETSLRYVKKLNTNWALRFNGTFTKGYDWMADNYQDINPDANSSTQLFGTENPALNPVNSYGNESSNRKTLTLDGKSYVVARTGYTEMEVTEYTLQNIKADAGIFYQNSKGDKFSYTFRFAVLDNIYQRANRFRLTDYFLQQHALTYQSKALQARVYLNNENTGNSYNLRSMAENIDRNYKTDKTWFADYTTGYNQAQQNGADAVNAHRQARQFADNGRYEPGTSAFNDVLGQLQQINNWDQGAALKVKASFIHAEMQLNLTDSWLRKWKEKTGLELLAGGDHRSYFVVPDGNYFMNPAAGKEGKNIVYSRTGVFLSVNRNFFAGKLRLGAAGRADKNDYYQVLFNPRVTVVYAPSASQSIRMSYQAGYRYPILFEAFSNVNSGGVKRVGGLPVMSDGIFENAWLQTSIAAFQSAILKDVNQGGISRPAAIEKNKELLVKNPYTYIQPEHVQSFDAGYKRGMANGKLLLDIEIYMNKYRSFIAQANMNVPKTDTPDSIPYYLADNTKQDQYRMWTNSKTSVYQYGGSIGLQWKLNKGYLVTAHTTYAKLHKAKGEDGLEDGFNTPEWMYFTSIANEKIYKQFGAGVSFRWQSEYYWQSFLINGDVPATTAFDMHISYRFAKSPFRLKLGGSNITNKYYYSILGGPSIGGMYYLTATWGL
ncbi:TonB-dependent receptor domain-containing protein [Flavihumibacter fluvii]|uniref:TonB-dependent receptor domain-containing protein n=1 Tax=Flavihumibacter fluvii TaxID=2838157 RepID=UPI001BDF37A4|nr:TonB-dependent receptor [Flavihumibacter fluvii]ULQ52745.1 TonB-dependent receptor plug domain-containing protein [Flavihumibacter fluvii]